VAALVTLAVVGVLYFGLTSAAFLKSVVLPRVGSAIHAKLTVEDLAFSPFKRLELRRVRLETQGSDPVFEAEEVLVRYSLFGLLAGDLVFPEVRLVGPRVSVVMGADGKSNIDPLVDSRTNRVETAAGEAPWAVKLDRLLVTNGVVRVTRIAADGSRQVSEVSNLGVQVETLANGASGKLALVGSASHQAAPAGPVAGTGDTLKAPFKGGFEFTLDGDLWPSAVKGDLRFTVDPAEGSYRELSGLSGLLTCEVSPTEVRALGLRFEKGGQRLGSAGLSGTIDLGKNEARLRLEVSGIDRNVLNLFGAPLGIDFVETAISASGMVDVSRRGSTVAATGKASATQFSLRRAGVASPPVDLGLDYQLTVSVDDETAVVHKFSVTGKREGRELLGVVLNRPMNLSWGQLVHGLNESVLDVTLSDLRLQDWRMFLPTNAPNGLISAKGRITCMSDGQRFVAELSGGGSELAAAAAGYAIKQGEAKFQCRAVFSDYRALHVEQYAFELNEQGTLLAKVTGSASYDLGSQDATLQAEIRSDLPAVVRYFPVPDLDVRQGRLTLETLITREKGMQKASADVGLTEFAGRYGPYQFTNYEARVDLDADMSDKFVNLRRAQVSLRQAPGPLGSLDISGRYDRVLEVGDFVLNLENLAEGGLEPLLAPMLAPRRLGTALVRGTANVHVDLRAESTATMAMEVAKLQLHGPDGPLPRLPIDLQAEGDAVYRTNVVEVKKLTVAFPATNRVHATARIELANANAVNGQLKLAAETLDLMPLYTAFTTNAAPAAAGTPPASGPGPGVPETEPPAMNLPIGLFLADVNVGLMRFGEVAISNWVASVRVTSNSVVIDPCRLTVNGGPVSTDARVDLGRPGYGYDVNLNAQQIPIEPFLRTLAPDQKGRVRGDLAAVFKVKGAGMTGASLQQNLSGQFDGGSTNLQLAIGNIRNSLLKSVVNVVIGIPDLVRNPTAVVGNVLSQLTGGGAGASKGGLLDEFANAPIQRITARGTLGGGRVNLEQAAVQSAAFQAGASGTITLAPVLTNSTLQMPVTVALQRALAQRVGLVPPGAPTNTPFVELPDFVTVEGTLGNPKTDVNKTALLALTARAGASLVGNTGDAGLDKASEVLNTVGNLLGGMAPGAKSETNRAAGATNAPAPKSILPINPLDLLKKR